MAPNSSSHQPAASALRIDVSLPSANKSRNSGGIRNVLDSRVIKVDPAMSSLEWMCLLIVHSSTTCGVVHLLERQA